MPKRALLSAAVSPSFPADGVSGIVPLALNRLCTAVGLLCTAVGFFRAAVRARAAVGLRALLAFRACTGI